MSGEQTATQNRPERIGALSRLPLFFALGGRRAVIAGGSPAAAWKTELLSATGARVDVYAADACSELLRLVADNPSGNVTLHRRAWTAADLTGAALAVADCRDDAEAATFAAAARDAGVPVNVIDRPAHCDFSFGAIVNRSPLVIGISTDGAAPVFARAIRGKIEALLARGFARWTLAATAWRAAVKGSGLSFAGRRRFWELFAAHAMANADAEPGHDDFARLVLKAKGRAGAFDRGAAMVVEVDREDPESLTLRAIRALQAADVILFDERVPRGMLDFARREATKVRIDNNKRDEDVGALIAELGKPSARVVRLKSCARIDVARIFRRAPGRDAPQLVPDGDLMTTN